MANDHFTRDEMKLIERLQKAPQPQLNPQRFASIREQMLERVDAPPSGPTGGSTAAAPLTGGNWLLWAILALAAVVIFAIIAALSNPAPSEEQPAIMPPTAVSSPIPAVPTSAASPSTPAETPNATATAPAAVATAAPLVVIEGPIESINGTIITIFDFEIQLEAGDPILGQIEVGDVVHVEGETAVGDVLILVPITITIIEAPPVVNPSGGGSPSVPDGCKVSKGKLKCSKKSKKSS